MEQLRNQNKPSYWESVGLFAGIFGVIYFFLPLVMGYKIIGSEGTGSLVTLLTFFLSICFACLIGAFGGMGSVWHYAKNKESSFKLSKGALIGFLTGAGIVIIKALLDVAWLSVDPDYIENLREGLIAVIEGTELPEEQKQMQIDTLASQFSSEKNLGSALLSLLFEIPVFGLLNLLTGMLGVKLFADQAEEI